MCALLRFGLALSSVSLLACAGGGTSSDASAPGRDSSTPAMDAGRDAGRRDAGSGVCAVGQHRCGAGCIDDLANEPAVGCRYGCGEPCPTPPEGTAACDAEGLCTFACDPPFFRDGGTCVCNARTCESAGALCGAPDDGCGRSLDCGTCAGGGVCMDGRCSCPPDAREPNDSRLSAPVMARLTDAPDSSASYDAFTLHTGSDVDWYAFDVSDEFDAGNPQIRIDLDRIPAGNDYDLAAYYVCTSGGDSSTCDAGTVDDMIGNGCASGATGTAAELVRIATECSGSDDSGRLYVRITSRTFGGSCAAYRFVVAVN